MSAKLRTHARRCRFTPGTQFSRVSSQHSGIPLDHFIGQRCTIYLAAYAQITLQRKLLSINGYVDINGVPRMWLFAEETVSPRVDKRANSAKPGV